MLSKLKIEDFAWRGNKDAIKLADLLPFVTFKASDLDGKPYTLTSEDLKLLELVDMKYEEHGSYRDYIAFKVRYNHISGTSVLRIPVSRRDYFMQKFEGVRTLLRSTTSVGLPISSPPVQGRS